MSELAPVLVIGGGGREHALAWSLAKSAAVSHVFVAPGNAGILNLPKASNIDLDVKCHEAVSGWCVKNEIRLVVVGPEGPIAAGLCDHLNTQGVACFGPSAAAARLESSKLFAKEFFQRHDIPTADYRAFTDAGAACSYINSLSERPLVVKASGLAAGKGVVVASDRVTACEAVNQLIQERMFGDAGDTILVEELLYGEEISCLAFSDGEVIACLPPAQDHKRLLDGDCGPNTGGMGAYCPCKAASPKDLELIQTDILQRTVDGMRSEGIPYVGILYAGIMLTADGPKVLEFNCRFGDPEAQVLLPLLTSDLYEVMLSCVKGRLPSCTPLRFHDDLVAVGVVAATAGYPGKYKKDIPIKGLSRLETQVGLLVFHGGTRLSGGRVVTAGGRVLVAVCCQPDVKAAAAGALAAVTAIQFSGKQWRTDIGARDIARMPGVSYRDSGVDIAAGDAFIGSIRPVVAATARPGCSSQIGMFGGVFDMRATGFRDALLICGADGVGTKLKVAHACNAHDTVGIDLVAMCVNDVLCHGAEPLFFLDYFACGKLDVDTAKTVIAGIANGCRQAGCTLLGGETAEMPGMYDAGLYDLAGFAVGAVERAQYLPRTADIVAGDVVVGLASSGIHSNGFSLVRHVVKRLHLNYTMTSPFDATQQLGPALLVPTKIYVRAVLPLLRAGRVKAIAHITGGGLPGNMARVLPPGVAATLDAQRWKMPPMFGWLYCKGGIEASEMARTFNCGIGMTLVVAASDQDVILNQLEEVGEESWVIGSILPQHLCHSQVEVQNLAAALDDAYSRCPPLDTLPAHVNGSTASDRKRVAVLISGTGSNLQALIDFTSDPCNNSAAQIVLVISNKKGVQGLAKARAAGIAWQVIEHQQFASRAQFDDALHETLTAARVDIVCLAGFMRILTGGFVARWQGRLLNVHPSLLPSFKGADVHRRVLQAGVRLSGCTVHFVSEEVDSGAILEQQSVPVYPTDTEHDLASRVKVAEHASYPRALELVAQGKAEQNGSSVIWH